MTRSFRLGLFIVATLAILGAGIFLIGSQQLRFHSTYQLNTHFQNVKGLEIGADVHVGGVHEGTIKHIVLPNQPGGEVTVVMEVERSTLGVVNRKSTASIESEGLLGDKYIEVSFGEKGAEALKDGDTIGSQPPIEFADLVKKTDQLLDTTNVAVRNVEGATVNVQQVTSKINEGKGTVGALINDPAIYQRANAGVAAFQEDMEALKHNFLLRGFFNKRGYEDETELAKNRISQLPAGPPLHSFAYDPSKIFGKNDRAKLRNPKDLNDAGHFLASNPFGLAVVAASTGDLGETGKDLTLSEARAMVIRDYLADHFPFDDTRVKISALGKSGSTPKVEILIYPTPTPEKDVASHKTAGP